MKKILLLGGAYAQTPVIKKAKDKGLYVITCDNEPKNPGHKFADEYFNVSTTDKDAVLELATNLQVDYVLAYASDPAAPVAAYVSQNLSLPGNSFKSVQMLSEKDLFRDFLIDNGFNAPKNLSFDESEDSEIILHGFRYPLIVKPTDSSGSKGVSKVYNEGEVNLAVEYALSFSRNKRVIIEEFIDSDGKQLHGDGFVINGELVFVCLGDHHYNIQVNPFVPFSTTWPSNLEDSSMSKVIEELKLFIRKSGFLNGTINIEVRLDINDDIYIMEVGPRSGGNFVPQVIEKGTSFNMVSALLELQEGSFTYKEYNFERPVAYYVVHSKQDGVLKKLELTKEIRQYLFEFHQYVQPGDTFKSFQGSNAAIAVLLMAFDDTEEMERIISNMSEYVRLETA